MYIFDMLLRLFKYMWKWIKAHLRYLVITEIFSFVLIKMQSKFHF